MKDPASQLRFATRRAKSHVANKLVAMFLHELSRQVSRDWPVKVDEERYEMSVVSSSRTGALTATATWEKPFA